MKKSNSRLGVAEIFKRTNKQNSAQKATSEQQRKNERKQTKRHHSNTDEQLKDTPQLRIIYQIPATTTKIHGSLQKSRRTLREGAREGSKGEAVEALHKIVAFQAVQPPARFVSKRPSERLFRAWQASVKK